MTTESQPPRPLLPPIFYKLFDEHTTKQIEHEYNTAEPDCSCCDHKNVNTDRIRQLAREAIISNGITLDTVLSNWRIQDVDAADLKAVLVPPPGYDGTRSTCEFRGTRDGDTWQFELPGAGDLYESFELPSESITEMTLSGPYRDSRTIPVPESGAVVHQINMLDRVWAQPSIYVKGQLDEKPHLKATIIYALPEIRMAILPYV